MASKHRFDRTEPGRIPAPALTGRMHTERVVRESKRDAEKRAQS